MAGSRPRASSRTWVAGSSTCTVSTRTSRCSRPWNSARCSTARVGSAPRPRAGECATLATRRVASMTSARGWAATNGRVRARSTCCATSSPRSTRPRSPVCTKPRRSPRTPTSWRMRKRTGARSPPRTKRSKARPRTPWVGPRRARGSGAVLGDRGTAARCRRRSRRRARFAWRSNRSSSIRSGWRLCRPAALLQELTRKYGPGLAEVLEYRTEIATRLEEARDPRRPGGRAGRGAGGRDHRCSAGRRGPDGPAQEGGPAARGGRHRAAPGPRDAPGDVPVELTAAELSDDGADDVTFVLAPNPGEPPRPLARAASGGELSRDAGAPSRVVEAPPTLVFDEVDAGIGGEAGSAVGRALAGLGGQHQVLCVTHLPQVAAFWAHVAVSKSEQGRTRATAARLLDARGRGARADARRRARLGARAGARARAAGARRFGAGQGARRVKLHRRVASEPQVVQGIARVDRRTKDLAKRIGKGEIAVIDHRDIDRVAGESLVAAGVGAVVNANLSISGRYPNGGPIRIVQGGIPILDDVGHDVMDRIRDGDLIELRDGGVARRREDRERRAAPGRRHRSAHGRRGR